MKETFKVIFTVCFLVVAGNVYCQHTGSKRQVTKPGSAVGSSVAIGLKNLCEKPVTIFAGSRDGLKNPKAKQKVYGGLSTNTLYVSINQVVCIIDEKGKPVSCANVKAGKSKMEVNTAGTVITAK